jgi:hypothetical protein
MFAMVVIFGLFHGLVFLPVLLSLMGPSSPAFNNCSSNEDDELNNVQKQLSNSHSNNSVTPDDPNNHQAVGVDAV